MPCSIMCSLKRTEKQAAIFLSCLRVEASNCFTFYWIQTDTAEIIGATLVLKLVTKKKHALSFHLVLKDGMFFLPSFVYQPGNEKWSPPHYTYIKWRCHWHLDSKHFEDFQPQRLGTHYSSLKDIFLKDFRSVMKHPGSCLIFQLFSV